MISNSDRPLAVAGIKGGTQAELTSDTVNIVLESASFSPALIRKTAQKLKIQTDASKRYENDFAPEVAEEAMELLTKIILEIAGTGDTKCGEVTDNFPSPTVVCKIILKEDDVENLLGFKISKTEIEDIFRRSGFEFEINDDGFVVTPPIERRDLQMKQDLIEEIAMIYGYDKIPDIEVKRGDFTSQVNKQYYYANKVRKTLIELGFAEIYTYAFAPTGDIEVIGKKM